MPTNIQPVIIRYHPGKRGDSDAREVLLFIPDMPANVGNIVCYSPIGQHGEASMEYYNETKPLHYAPASYKAAAQLLLDEYKALCEMHGFKMKVVQRDTPKFRATRWRKYL